MNHTKKRKRKILFFLLDGLGDEGYHELGNKTPLEYAKTPNFDRLVENGCAGLLVPKGLGRTVPLSSASNMLFSTLGYDVRRMNPKRGVVEAIGSGIKIKEGYLCARCNFSSVDKNWKIKKLRVRVSGSRVKAFEKAINSIDFKIPFVFKSTVGHRGVLVFKGEFSDEITEVDPHKIGVKVRKCRAKTRRGKRSAGLVNEFMEKAHEALKGYSANFLLMRGFGSHIPKVDSFKKKFGLKACGLTGLDVNKGVLKILGIDVIYIPEEIGGKRELEVKKRPIEKALKKYDFLFVHFKNIDDPGHEGDVKEKVRQIELTDKFIDSLDLEKEDILVVITSDHSTSCKNKSHSKHPIPTLLSPDHGTSEKFGERYCKDFKMPSYELMRLIRAVVV